MHGIGTGGDSANPNSGGGMKESLKTNAYTITADILQRAESLLLVSRGGRVTVTYTIQQQGGKFDGSVNLAKRICHRTVHSEDKTDQYASDQ